MVIWTIPVGLVGLVLTLGGSRTDRMKVMYLGVFILVGCAVWARYS
jgi:hypothetical protein